MPLTLLPALPSDIPEIVATSLSAFWYSNQDSVLLSRDPFKEETAEGEGGKKKGETVRGFLERRYWDQWLEDADLRVMKVVERRGSGSADRTNKENAGSGGEAGAGEGEVEEKVSGVEEEEFVAEARWHFYLAGSKEGKESEENGKKKEAEETEYPDGFRGDMMNELSRTTKRYRREIMGEKPYSKSVFSSWLLYAFDGFLKGFDGAGGMLLKWGTERADGAGLPMYVESTEMGKPLYERFGYETVHVMETDLAALGGRGIDKRYLMIRSPRERHVV
ncbi:MAG: hypothetical protein Q9165_001641 [Trypethelium subeluteriae]